MPRYLLDTSTVSAPLAKIPSPTIISRLELHGHECAIAAPVWHELLFGCQRLPRGKRRQALEAYVESVVRVAFPIIPYDDVAAAWHARERSRLETRGRPMPHVDAQIAAIAAVNELTLVTCNAKDFAPYKELRVEDWSVRARGAGSGG